MRHNEQQGCRLDLNCDSTLSSSLLFLFLLKLQPLQYQQLPLIQPLPGLSEPPLALQAGLLLTTEPLLLCFDPCCSPQMFPVPLALLHQLSLHVHVMAALNQHARATLFVHFIRVGQRPQNPRDARVNVEIGVRVTSL